MEKHKCKFVTKRFQHLPGVHFNLKHAPTVSGASPTKYVATAAAMEDRELRHLGVKQVFIEAISDREILIKPSEGYKTSR